MYIVHEINLLPNDLNSKLKLLNALFEAVKFTKNSNPDSYNYLGYDVGFDIWRTLLLPDGSGFGKNLRMFVADSSSYVHANNKTKDIVILDKGPTDGLDNITKTAEAEYSINLNEKQKKFPLSLYYNGSSSYLFASWVKIY